MQQNGISRPSGATPLNKIMADTPLAPAVRELVVTCWGTFLQTLGA